MITTQSEILDALANNSSRIIIDKASLANQTTGGFASLWRATGQPAQGAIPTAAAICTSVLTGAMGFANQTTPVSSYLGWLWANSNNNGQSFEIHDRLAHMGGLVLNVTTQQNIASLDLSTIGVAADRIGDANYSDVQWWLEVYTDGGATASNATINVTYNDGSTGNLNVTAVGGTLRASRLIALTPLIPTAQQGKFIRGINSVTLSASTAAAGNFGFTATRPRTSVAVGIANKTETYDWAQLGLPEIANNSCLAILMVCITTNTSTLRGGGKIAHG